MDLEWNSLASIKCTLLISGLSEVEPWRGSGENSEKVFHYEDPISFPVVVHPTVMSSWGGEDPALKLPHRKKANINVHEFHETCHSVTFYFMKKRLQMML